MFGKFLATISNKYWQLPLVALGFALVAIPVGLLHFYNQPVSIFGQLSPSQLQSVQTRPDPQLGRQNAVDLGNITNTTKKFKRNRISSGDKYYKFSLSTAKKVGLGLRRLDYNANLVLENAQGWSLASSAEAGTDNEWLTQTLAAGDYYIKVSAVEAGLNKFILRFGASDASPAQLEALHKKAVIKDDIISPTITSITVDPVDSHHRRYISVGVGTRLIMRVNISEDVTVQGNPILGINLPDNSAGFANYNAALSSSNQLVFKYVVKVGDYADQLTFLNQLIIWAPASIQDAASNNLLKTVPQDYRSFDIRIDAAAPEVTEIIVDTPNGTDVGDKVYFLFVWSDDLMMLTGWRATINANAYAYTGWSEYVFYDSPGEYLYQDNLAQDRGIYDHIFAYSYTIRTGDDVSDLQVTGVEVTETLPNPFWYAVDGNKNYTYQLDLP